jgi:SAM-dependent methyltransferase
MDMSPTHWPTFLRELDAAEQTWRQWDVRYERPDAVPFMPYAIPDFVKLLTEAVAACARPRNDSLSPYYEPLPPGAITFLDAGCGPGTKCRLAAAMFGLKVRGIDIVPRFVGEAQSHGVDAIVADAFEFFAPDDQPNGTFRGSIHRYDIILVNRPSGLQDELEPLIMDAMAPDAVLIAVNWKHDPAKERGWMPHYQEYGEPVAGVFIKP